jgi:SAM-dependent methyltransferase
MTLHASQDESLRRRRVHHAERTAESHAAFLLPHLQPGMALLDLGCGPGSITVGLAEAVAPGPATGVDLNPQPVEGVTVVAADVYELPFPDASFDAIFASAVLQHLADPLAALREARRVARPGAVIGVVDADWDGELIHPTDPVLRRSLDIAVRLREGTSPRIGKQLRQLLLEAGFSRAEASARTLFHGTDAEIHQVGAFTASLFQYPATVDRVVGAGWATAAELDEMSRAWSAWAQTPGAFLARFWCEALAWAD